MKKGDIGMYESKNGIRIRRKMVVVLKVHKLYCKIYFVKAKKSKKIRRIGRGSIRFPTDYFQSRQKHLNKLSSVLTCVKI